MGDYLQDPRLLFEIFILIRLGIGKVVNFDSMFIDLIQDLPRRARKQPQSPLEHLQLEFLSQRQPLPSETAANPLLFLVQRDFQSEEAKARPSNVALTLRLSLSLSLRVSVSALAMTGTTLTLL